MSASKWLKPLVYILLVVLGAQNFLFFSFLHAADSKRAAAQAQVLDLTKKLQASQQSQQQSQQIDQIDQIDQMAAVHAKLEGSMPSAASTAVAVAPAYRKLPTIDRSGGPEGGVLWSPSVLANPGFASKQQQESYQCAYPDPSKSCTWEAGEEFFRFRTEDDAMSDDELAGLKVLVVDQHGGPLLDTIAFFKRIGVQHIKAFCGLGVHCSRADTSPEYNALHKIMPWDMEWDQKFNKRTELAEQVKKMGLPEVDLIVCLYPGIQCSWLASLAKMMIVRFALRWQHGLGKMDDFLGWARNLRRIASCGNMAVSGTSATDHLVLKRELGINQLPWPSLALNMGGDERTPGSYLVLPTTARLLYTHLHPYVSHEFQGLFQQLILKASDGNRLFDSDHAHWHSKDFSDYAAIVLVPYGPQVTKYVEYYMKGVPLIVPSLELFNQWNEGHGVCRHRAFNKRPWNDGWQWDYTLFPETAQSVCCGAHSTWRNATKHWLHSADYFHWPNVTYFTTAEDLRYAFLKIRDDPPHRAALVAGMTAFRQDLTLRTERIMKVQLARMVAAQETDSACSPDVLLDLPL